VHRFVGEQLEDGGANVAARRPSAAPVVPAAAMAVMVCGAVMMLPAAACTFVVRRSHVFSFVVLVTLTIR
jgi:hypothetical protein